MLGAFFFYLNDKFVCQLVSSGHDNMLTLTVPVVAALCYGGKLFSYWNT